MASRQTGRNEIKIWRRGLCNASNTDLHTLVESCPVSKSWQPCMGPGSLAATIFFTKPEDAVEGFVYVWKQRLLGFHGYTPEIRLAPQNDEIRRRVRTVFLNYVGELREGEAASECRREIEEVERELSKCCRRIRGKNRLMEWSRLEGLKQGLTAQREILRKKMEEFERALKCLELYLWNQVRDGEGFDDNGDRFVFALGNSWTWEQLHGIIVRELSRLEAGLPMYSSRREILQLVDSNQVFKNFRPVFV